MAEAEEQIQEDSLGFASVGIRSGIVAGIISIVAAIAWFILELGVKKKKAENLAEREELLDSDAQL